MVQSDDDVEATHSQMQLAILEWGDLIRIMGGFLAPNKSAWYLVDYKWRRGKWKYKNPGKEKVLEATNKPGEIAPL